MTAPTIRRTRVLIQFSFGRRSGELRAILPETRQCRRPYLIRGYAAERDAEAPPASDGARRRAEPADRQSLALGTAPRHRTKSESRAMNAGIAFQM